MAHKKDLCACGNEKGVDAERCIPCKHKHCSKLLKGRNHKERQPVSEKTYSNLTMHKYLQQPLMRKSK